MRPCSARIVMVGTLVIQHARQFVTKSTRSDAMIKTNRSLATRDSPGRFRCRWDSACLADRCTATGWVRTFRQGSSILPSTALPVLSCLQRT